MWFDDNNLKHWEGPSVIIKSLSVINNFSSEINDLGRLNVIYMYTLDALGKLPTLPHSLKIMEFEVEKER